jgi:gluconate 2-dehydrogenase gamma chain
LTERAWLADWHGRLLTRRRFLLQLAGGSLAALFPWTGGAAPALSGAARWRLLDAVQRHLFPSEPNAPGAGEINALDYLRFILGHDPDKAEDRQFLLQGAGWLEDMAQRLAGASFLKLDEAGRERVLRGIEKSEAGGNWLSLILVYLIEALLADPVYGGNPDGVGWRWLAHVPGFPLPPPGKRYMELRKR